MYTSQPLLFAKVRKASTYIERLQERFSSLVASILADRGSLLVRHFGDEAIPGILVHLESRRCLLG